MAKFRRKKITSEYEKKIISLMIISTDFLKDLYSFVQTEYFETPYAKLIWPWVKEHYDEYGVAPHKNISAYYNMYKSTLKDNDAVVAAFLTELDNYYEEAFNEDFFKDRAIDYFRKRSLITLFENGRALVEVDNIDDAESLVKGYKNIRKISSESYNFFDLDYLNNHYRSENIDEMFTLPGAVGELTGPICREWLVGIQASYGLGKTTTLSEIAVCALSKKMNVIDFNLEMGHYRMAQRIYSRVTSRTNKEGVILYPVFDCAWNQNGECNKSYRANQVVLSDVDGYQPKWGSHNPNYNVCTHCRRNNGLSHEYSMSTWFVEAKRDALSEEIIAKKIKDLQHNIGRYRFVQLPKFGASVTDIVTTLDMIEEEHDFVPDVIIVDYADILAPERKRYDNEETRINETWMALSRLALERRAVVITATQINKEALKRQKGQMGDASGSARAKYAHTDLMIAISQTPEEKSIGASRFNIVKHRHRASNPIHEVVALQNLKVHNMILDSEFTSYAHMKEINDYSEDY